MLKKMSEKNKLRFKDQKFVKIQSISILIGFGLLVLISILFLSLKFIAPEKNILMFNNFFDLGLDCWALILGFLCILKSIHDKHVYALSLNQDDD